jgi:hypothetical protein
VQIENNIPVNINKEIALAFLGVDESLNLNKARERDK